MPFVRARSTSRAASAVADPAALPGVRHGQRQVGNRAPAVARGVAPDADDLPGRLVDRDERLVGLVIDVGEIVELARGESRLGAQEAVVARLIDRRSKASASGARSAGSIGRTRRRAPSASVICPGMASDPARTRDLRPAAERRLCSVPSAMPSSRAASPAR